MSEDRKLTGLVLWILVALGLFAVLLMAAAVIFVVGF